VRAKRQLARPRPWAFNGAFIGAVAAFAWVPSWTFSAVLTPIGLICVALGWTSERRRWLLWAALLLNVVVLAGTALIWLSDS
jgi:hypothetical protein